MKSQVFVSGVGIVSPLGSSREATWKALIEGKNGIVHSESGSEARIFDFSPNGARSRMGDFAILSAAEALRHAGLDLSQIRGKNIGCAVSQSKPILFPHANSEGKSVLDAQMLLSSFFGWSAESVVQREFELNGPTVNVVAACATGIASIQTGVQWIESGLCDIVLVGAAESSLNNFYRAGFMQMGVLAPGSAQPFDKNRSGFVMGEGAAVMVLESARSLQDRGHKALASVLNSVLRQSPQDSLRFDSDGDSVASLISQATNGFDLPDYINAHGTGTIFNDLAETRGIKKAFGKKSQNIPISSTKAATGHLLGAAGAVEAAFAVLALDRNSIPPTLNLNTPDPECDLDYVPQKSRRLPLSSSLSLSYGFGGQMGAVLFGKVN